MRRSLNGLVRKMIDRVDAMPLRLGTSLIFQLYDSHVVDGEPTQGGDGTGLRLSGHENPFKNVEM